MMERDYADGIGDDAIFFVGIEVENTPQKGAHTLFVVGVQDANRIHELAQKHVCRHIYLGANQSFDVDGATGWDRWDAMSVALLDLGYWVTLDFNLSHWTAVLGMRANGHPQFIPQVSVKLPNISAANYNTCIKIDDIGFKASNPGVWVHSLHDLIGRGEFTAWDSYGKDERI
jgi:hypothetical protein